MTIEDRLTALEKRVQLAEDRLAITQLIYSYGPAVDTGSSQAAADLFAADGVYDVDTGPLEGRGAISEMVLGDMHQRIIGTGAGHLMMAPQIQLDGDTAVVVSYSLLILRKPSADTYFVARLTANDWDLARIDGAWKVTHRTARLIGGEGSEGRSVLARLMWADAE